MTKIGSDFTSQTQKQRKTKWINQTLTLYDSSCLVIGVTVFQQGEQAVSGE